jgi:hypothetical protein
LVICKMYIRAYQGTHFTEVLRGVYQGTHFTEVFRGMYQGTHLCVPFRRSSPAALSR